MRNDMTDAALRVLRERTELVRALEDEHAKARIKLLDDYREVALALRPFDVEVAEDLKLGVALAVGCKYYEVDEIAGLEFPL